MLRSLIVEDDCLGQLKSLASRYNGIRSGLKIGNIIPATQAFVQEIDERRTNLGFVARLAEGRVGLYVVPEADLGGGTPELDVGVVVGVANARLFFVEDLLGSESQEATRERLKSAADGAADRLMND